MENLEFAETDFDLAIKFAECALRADCDSWAKFFHGIARFHWSRAEEGAK